MSLIDDLRSVDLSPVLAAKDAIRTAIADPGLAALARDGAATAVLGRLGTGFEALRQAAAGDPAALIAPLGDAMSALVGRLDAGDLPLGRYGAAVEEGAAIVARILADLDGDPARLGKSLGMGLGDILDHAQAQVTQHVRLGETELGRLRHLIDTVENGVPTDPEALARLALDALSPFARGHLEDLRRGARRVLDGATVIDVPVTRTAGLITGLAAVTAAARAGDAAATDRALRDLERTRVHTIGQIRTDLFDAVAAIDAIDISGALAPLTKSRDLLRSAEDGLLDLMSTIQRDIRRARSLLGLMQAGPANAFLDQIVGKAEAVVRERILDPVDRQAARAVTLVHDVFGRLRLRAIRGEVTEFLVRIARAIDGAGLDAPARRVRELLAEVRAAVSSEALAAEIQAALRDVKDAIDRALGQVVAALEVAGDAIEAVADQAASVLQRAAAALRTFRGAVDRATQALEHAGLTEAGDRVARTLNDLRDTAATILGLAPLPESLRKQIRQLVELLERVDLDATLFRPIRAAVAELHVPADIEASVTEGLHTIADVASNLIPDELIASIEADVQATLDQIARLDPSALTATLRGYLDDAAGLVEQLSPSPELAATIQGPYERVLGALDAVDPRTLLAPVIRAYDNLLGKVPVPSPETMARRTNTLLGNSGDRLGRTIAEPMRRFVPGAAERPADQPPAGPPPAGEESVRAGDVVRMLGYIPRKLREVFAALPTADAERALRGLHDLHGGLAAALRGATPAIVDVERRLERGVDRMLAGLASPLLEARVALAGSFPGGAGLAADTTVLVRLDPGTLRDAVADARGAATNRARRAAGDLARAAGGALDHAATALEESTLGRLAGDLTGLLAALDPEPVAAELDDLLQSVLARVPDLMPQIEASLLQAVARARVLIDDVSLTSLARRFDPVLDALLAELEVLDPRMLADELAMVHQALRRTVEAFDPARFIAELRSIVAGVAAQLRAIDPGVLVGDLSFLTGTLDRVREAMPSHALAGVGASLDAVGAELAAVDVPGLIDGIEALAPRALDEAERVVETTRREVVALLRTLSAAGGPT